jgi:hypothetical protein
LIGNRTDMLADILASMDKGEEDTWAKIDLLH